MAVSTSASISAVVDMPYIVYGCQENALPVLPDWQWVAPVYRRKKRQHGLRAAFHAPLVPLPCHASPGPAGPCLASPQIADTPPLHHWCPCHARPGPALPRLASPRVELSNLYFLGNASRPINQCLPIVRDFAASCVGDFICRCPRCSAVLVDGCCDPPLVIC